MELRPYKNFELEDMENEIWKDVVNFEDIYQVSNFGRVKTKKRILYYDRNRGFGDEKKTVYPRIRKQKINKHTGYLFVGLNSKGRTTNYTVHSLIGEAFSGYKRGQGKGSDKNCMNHKDGDKLNNTLQNLEVVTIRENVIHMNKFLKPVQSHRVVFENKEYYSKSEFKRRTGISENKMKKMIRSGEIIVIKNIR